MLIFTYGTLKSGCKNSSVLAGVDATLIGHAETVLPYPMFDLGDGFPYLQDDPGDGQSITGEVWEVQDKFQDRLDDFEGVPNLYVRGNIDVYLNSETENVLCYFKAKKVSLDNLDLMDIWEEEDNPFNREDFLNGAFGRNG